MNYKVHYKASDAKINRERFFKEFQEQIKRNPRNLKGEPRDPEVIYQKISNVLDFYAAEGYHTEDITYQLDSSTDRYTIRSYIQLKIKTYVIELSFSFACRDTERDAAYKSYKSGTAGQVQYAVFTRSELRFCDLNDIRIGNLFSSIKQNVEDWIYDEEPFDFLKALFEFYEPFVEQEILKKNATPYKNIHRLNNDVTAEVKLGWMYFLPDKTLISKTILLNRNKKLVEKTGNDGNTAFEPMSKEELKFFDELGFDLYAIYASSVKQTIKDWK